MKLMVLYDDRHTISASRYAAAKALDTGCSRRDWRTALQAAGVHSMGFGVVVAHWTGRACGTSLASGNASDCGEESPRQPARRSMRLCLDEPHGTEATATLLSGRGLQTLRRAAGFDFIAAANVGSAHVKEQAHDSSSHTHCLKKRSHVVERLIKDAGGGDAGVSKRNGQLGCFGVIVAPGRRKPSV